jgi:di/tricarboxylate transporter
VTGPMLVVFGILAGAIVLFAWGRPRVDVVAVLVVLALILSRVLTPREALAGFGDPIVVLIAAIFIVGEGLVNTGVVHRLGESVTKLGGGNETRVIVLIMTLAGAVGAFMSSTAIAAMFIPLVLTVARKTSLNGKRMLMPLSVAALISGMMTLIASSPNMIVEGTLRSRGLAPLDFFSWTPFGLAMLAAAIVFMLAARGLLSKQLAAKDAVASTPSVHDLVGSYGLTGRWHRLRVLAGSPLIDRSVAQIKQLHDDSGAVLVGFEKISHGKSRFLPALLESVFETDDTVFIVAEMEAARQLIQTLLLEEMPHLDERTRAEVLQELGTAELMLAPESKLIGKRLGDIDFRSRYHVSVLAIRHRGEALTAGLFNRTLDFGDTLLVAGDWADIGKLWDDRDDFVVLTLPAEYQERLPARQHATLAIAILAVMVAVMAFGVIPNAAAALLAALAMIARGCVRLDAIYRIISWKTVVLIAGMLPLATALTKTGATDLMAKELVAALGSIGPIAMLIVVFLVTALVGLFVSNSTTAVLIGPIAIDAAQALHISPYAFAMTVSIACCAAYVTPVSSPVNMLVMEPGGYAFGDYVKVGLPLLLLTLLVTVALVAVIYPL